MFILYSPFSSAGKPPVDEFTEEERYLEISPALFISITTISALGILLTIFFLAFNIKYMNHRWVVWFHLRLKSYIFSGRNDQPMIVLSGDWLTDSPKIIKLLPCWSFYVSYTDYPNIKSCQLGVKRGAFFATLIGSR